MQTSEKTIFFDGHCNLCNGIIKFIIRRDGKNIFKFASLQSKAAEGLNLGKENPDTIYFRNGSRLTSKSDAALKIFKYLRFPWCLLHGLIIFPRRLRDSVYHLISENRYKWFGRSDECLIPSPEIQNRFLE